MNEEGTKCEKEIPSDYLFYFFNSFLNQLFLYNTDQNLAEAIKGEENQMELAKTDDVVLLANKQSEGGMFKEITVQTECKSKTFPWVNTSNPTYVPIAHITDVNKDGRKEIVVILTTGTGTGVHLEEIHVLNRENLTEIIPGVENPFDAIYKKVGSKISKNNGKVNVVVEWDDKKIEKTYNESDAGVWNKGVGFGGFVNYQLHNNNIYAIVPGFATPSLTVVEAIVEYDSDFKARSITVKDIDEADWPDC
ncbi:hypothetical protein ABDB91_02270 [Desulfoscipio sp. XC116]|uniref:hypothetical protein n=1 Tax=Desulfoscipio sp. XC116 TaxID=3144975 RepID=UPI00325B79C0